MRELSPLQAAAQRKHAAAVERATVALSALAAEGATITFQQVARRAGVSRQWLYGQPLLRAKIEELRQRPASGVPAPERSSEAWLHQRLRTTLDENQALREQNQALKHELALAYGARREPAPITRAGARSGSALGGASK